LGWGNDFKTLEWLYLWFVTTQIEGIYELEWSIPQHADAWICAGLLKRATLFSADFLYQSG
jgi:hypothetical protein